MTLTSEPCGRLTRAKTLCRLLPMTYWDFPKWEGRPHSCYGHLTAEERAAYEHEKADAGGRREAAQRHFMTLEPAYWKWPVLQGHGDSSPDIEDVGAGDEELNPETPKPCGGSAAGKASWSPTTTTAGLIRGLLRSSRTWWASHSIRFSSG